MNCVTVEMVSLQDCNWPSAQNIEVADVPKKIENNLKHKAVLNEMLDILDGLQTPKFQFHPSLKLLKNMLYPVPQLQILSSILCFRIRNVDPSQYVDLIGLEWVKNLVT